MGGLKMELAEKNADGGRSSPATQFSYRSLDRTNPVANITPSELEGLRKNAIGSLLLPGPN
jgi:hypothetical protein